MIRPAAKWLSAAKWLLGAVGFVLLAVGAVKITATSGDAGVVTLVVAGALLLISPFVIDRVEGVSVSTTSFELRLTREITDLGAPKAAQILQFTALGSFAETYAFIHEELGDPTYYVPRCGCKTF